MPFPLQQRCPAAAVPAGRPTTAKYTMPLPGQQRCALCRCSTAPGSTPDNSDVHFAASAAAQLISIESAPGSAAAIGDRVMVEGLVANLTDNAVRYHAPAGDHYQRRFKCG